jgi:hypothetical protein
VQVSSHRELTADVSLDFLWWRVWQKRPNLDDGCAHPHRSNVA